MLREGRESLTGSAQAPYSPPNRFSIPLVPSDYWHPDRCHVLGVSEQSHSEELQVCSMASAATPPGNIAVATSGSACSNEVCGSNVEMETDCEGGATAELAQKLAEVLEDAVRVRVRNAPRVLTPPTSEVSGPKEGAVVMGGARVAVLFSGGVDSAVIAGQVCVCVSVLSEWYAYLNNFVLLCL